MQTSGETITEMTQILVFNEQCSNNFSQLNSQEQIILKNIITSNIEVSRDLTSEQVSLKEKLLNNNTNENLFHEYSSNKNLTIVVVLIYIISTIFK